MAMGGVRRRTGGSGFVAAIAAVIMLGLAGLAATVGFAAPSGTIGGDEAAAVAAVQQDRDDAYRLVVPGVIRERPAPLRGHTVEAGDTLPRIATLYGTTLSLLTGLNTVADPRQLPVGSQVLVPQPGPPPRVLPCGDLLAPVDKNHSLPANCVPESLQALPLAVQYGGTQYLTSVAAEALLEMLDDAEAAGHELYVRSSYRSYALQEETFQTWVELLGLAEALQVSARAGHSEHQLGTTADLTNEDVDYDLVESFADTPGGRWVANNAARYGFVISYPKGREPETGYSFEPWHVRYVGVEVAEALKRSGMTLNHYLESIWLPGRYALD